MAYDGIGFINDNPPAINAENLNKMDNELVYLDGNLNNTKDSMSYNMNAVWQVGRWGIASGTHKVQYSSSEAWEQTVVNCVAKNWYRIRTNIYGYTYYAVLFTDDSDLVLANYEVSVSGVEKEIDKIYQAPTGATKIYVNYHILSGYSGPSVYQYTNEEEVNEIGNQLNEVANRLMSDLDLSFTLGQYRITTNTNKVVKGTSTAWKGAFTSVKEGELYNVVTEIYGSEYYAVIFANDEQDVLATYERAETNVNVRVDVTVSVPENATKMYINYRINDVLTEPKVKLYYVFSKSEAAKAEQTLYKIASVNCGTFDHYRPDSQHLTDDEYKVNWRKDINKSEFDFFVLVDCPFAKASSPYTESDLFGNITKGKVNLNDQYIEYREDIGESSILDVRSTVTVDGQTYTNNNRHTFLRAILQIGDIRIAIYAIHASPQLAPGYEHLRAAQFEDLLADANNYDGFIFCGDFNCQTSDEYDIFAEAGCRMGNCGYLGTFNTLREIPADNIIVSDNIVIKQFALLDDYDLNSDHLPIFAIIQYVG